MPSFIFLFPQWGPSFMELTGHRLQGPSCGPVQTPWGTDEETEFPSEGGACSSGSPVRLLCPSSLPLVTSPPSPSALKLPRMQEAVRVCHGQGLLKMPQGCPWSLPPRELSPLREGSGRAWQLTHHTEGGGGGGDPVLEPQVVSSGLRLASHLLGSGGGGGGPLLVPLCNTKVWG